MFIFNADNVEDFDRRLEGLNIVSDKSILWGWVAVYMLLRHYWLTRSVIVSSDRPNA